MVESTIFIGTIVIAITKLIKYYAPKIQGPYSIVVAAVVGGLVGLVDQFIGVTDITIAAGLMTGLGAAGVVYTASKVAHGSAPRK